ncbi:MAG: alkaline phosphatase family protein [Clostridiales bacterium]|nr:alkaline phosphatase family protein [Clostridiales bacterium]
MKKSAKICLILFVAVVLAAAATLVFLFPPVVETGYEEKVDALSFMENTRQTAVPQTEIYNLISDHFNSALPEGKTEKKAIVIGYDGCRADTFTLLDSEHKSAINTLINDGGQAVFSYCGGVNMPEKNTQDTSTAPGWCSMLTGKWAETHGVYKNYQPKEIEPKTLLISLIEDGKIDSSAFYVSWAGHFSKPKATYINELNYIEENKINSVFLRAENDDGTKANVLADINKADCSDFIFLTLEYTDHNGHATGFSLDNPNYTNGFYSADETGLEFIEAIKSRKTYENEDWLILITTDHGGIRRNHGGPSVQERTTFIVSNKEIAH